MTVVEPLPPPATTLVVAGGRSSARRRVRTAAGLLGPAFVASVAYVDPGNFATNFGAGASRGYELVWVVLVANLMAVLVQYLSAKVGLATGHSLPELCREQYRRPVNIVMWLQAEMVAMATDLAEFVGAALGLHLIFGMGLLPAGLITAGVAFLILGLERRGRRRFELAIVAMLGLVTGGFLYVLFAAGGQHYAGLAHGLVPRLGGDDGLGLAVGILGATVMPHVVYLHSHLQRRHSAGTDAASRQARLRGIRWDCGVGLGLAGLTNLAMLCIAAALCRAPRPFSGTNLADVHARLATVVGGGAALAFGVALLASGLSSASVGTYAGQVVMGGFINRRISLVLRRTLTMAPSLVVLAVSADGGSALVYSQIVLSFGIPFALVPLLLLTNRADVMGEMVNNRMTTTAMLLITVIVIGLNGCFIVAALRG